MRHSKYSCHCLWCLNQSETSYKIIITAFTTHLQVGCRKKCCRKCFYLEVYVCTREYFIRVTSCSDFYRTKGFFCLTVMPSNPQNGSPVTVGAPCGHRQPPWKHLTLNRGEKHKPNPRWLQWNEAKSASQRFWETVRKDFSLINTSYILLKYELMSDSVMYHTYWSITVSVNQAYYFLLKSIVEQFLTFFFKNRYFY